MSINTVLLARVHIILNYSSYAFIQKGRMREHALLNKNMNT